MAAIVSTVEISRPPGEAFSYAQGVDGPIRVKVPLAVEPLDDGARSRVTISLDFKGRGFGKLIVPLFVRRQAASEAPDSCRRLKERLEQGLSRG